MKSQSAFLCRAIAVVQAIAAACCLAAAGPYSFQAQHSNDARTDARAVDGGWEAVIRQKSSFGEQFDNRLSILLEGQGVVKGRKYTVSFRLRASQPMKVNVDWKQSHAPYNFIGGTPRLSGLSVLAAGEEDSEHSFSLLAVIDAPPGGSAVNFYFGDNQSGGVLTIRDLKISEELPAIPLDLREAANFGFKDQTPGDGQGGWSDQGMESDFGTFPIHQKEFAGVPFRIIDPERNDGRAVLSFQSSEVATGLKSARIVLPETRRYLYLLHAATFAHQNGNDAVGNIRFDGWVAQVPVAVKNNIDVADWWSPRDFGNAVVGYAGRNAGGRKVAVFVSKFEIPIGTDQIVLEAMPGRANWIVVAATISDGDMMQQRREQLTITASREWRPIGMPFYVQKGTALDFSGGNRRPIGDDDWIIARADGQLAQRKSPEKAVRLNGCNFVPHRLFGYPVHWMNLPWPQRRKAIDDYADGVAATGCNALRWHMVDYALIYGGRPGNSLEPLPLNPEDVPLNPEAVETFFYLFHALKERGVYAVMDMVTTFSGWTDCYPWPANAPADSQISSRYYRNAIYYSQRLRENWKAGVQRLLTMVNPHTGLALVDDPALVGVTCINEQYFEWQDRDCKALEPQWQAWMRRRTGEDRAFPALGKAAQMKNDEIGAAMALFIQEKEREVFAFYEKTLRDIGFKGLVSNDINFSMANIPVLQQFGNVAWHPYVAHPNYVNGGVIISNDSALLPASCNPYRFFNRPLFINEYNHVMWNQYRHEGNIRYATLAGLQNWSAYFPHSDSVFPLASPMEPFAISQDPVWRGQMAVAYFAFARGDVMANPQKVGLEITPKDIERKGGSGISYSLGAIAWLAQCGIWLDDGRNERPDVGLMLGPSGEYRQGDGAMPDGRILNLARIVEQMRTHGVIPADNLTDVGGGIFQSGSGEVLLNAAQNEITVASPRLEMCVVKSDHPAKMGALSLKSASIPAGIAAASLDEDRSLADTGHVLLIITTDALNSNQRFASPQRLELLDRGTLPVLLRCGKFEFELESAMRSPALYALDCAGNRTEKLPVASSGGMLGLSVDMQALKEPAVFFELVDESNL